MLFSNSSADYRPLFWVGRYPVSASVLLIVVHSLAMIAYSLCLAFGVGGVFATLIFSSADVLHRGYVWQLVTYPFVEAASLMFVFQMFMLYWFGPDVERFIGRNYFLALYAALIVVPVLVLTALSAFLGPIQYSGASSILFGVFIAFVAIYPDAELAFFRIRLKWAAAILLGIYTLAFLASRDLLGLLMLWLSAGVAAVAIRSLGVATGFGFFDRIHEWFESRRMERLAKQNNIRAIQEQEKVESIDNILDKISKHGMGSLTPIEKKILERASADLIKRDKPH